MKPPQPSSNGTPVALIYTRVSSDEQARDGTSLDAQLAECRRYVLRHEWIIDSEYTDVMSGRRDDRPDYQALLQHVRALRVDRRPAVVVVAALDRLGRRLLERVRCREELKALGVSTHSVREGGEVSDLVANILGSVAQEEVARMGMRISHAWRHHASQGWHRVGGHSTTWGYRTRKATEEERREGSPNVVIEIDPERALYAREMFERIAAGETSRSVMRWARALPADIRGGRAMSRRTLLYMLRAPVYAGLVAVNGPQGRWEPLVQDVIWRQVQDRMDGHRNVPRQASGRYLLTGLLRCPLCGGRMRGGDVTIGRPGQRIKVARYRCFSRADGTGDCTETAQANYVDALVLGEVGALLERVTTDPTLQVALRKQWDATQMPLAADTKHVKQLEASVARGRQRIVGATEKFVDGDIDKSAYDALCAKTQASMKAAEDELARLRNTSQSHTPLPPFDQVLNELGGWSAALQGADLMAKRELLAGLIQAIVPGRVGRGKYTVDITWTPLGEALRASH